MIKFDRNILIAVIMLVFSFCFPAVSAAAEAENFSAVMPDSVGVGRSFDIVIQYGGSEPLSAVQFNIDYDMDYFSFKKAEGAGNSETTFKDENGTLAIICLYNDFAEKGDVLTLTFTAKTGNSSADKSFYFECVQAVSGKLTNIDCQMTPEKEISVVRKSDSSAQTSRSTGTTGNNTASAKNKASSVSTDTSSITAQFSTSFAENEENIADEFDDEEFRYESSHLSENNERLYGSESKAKLVLAGAGGAIAVMGIIFSLYKYGKMSSNQN